MEKLRKVLLLVIISCACTWLLTLGIFVDDDISNEFLASSSFPELPGCFFKMRVTSDEKSTFGLPYLFFYRKTVSRFGLILMAQCESPEVSKLIIKEMKINGETRSQNEPIQLRKSRGGRKYNSVFRGTLATQLPDHTDNEYSVTLVCSALMRDGSEKTVVVNQEVPIHWERRWSFGWTMLLYYSQF